MAKSYYYYSCFSSFRHPETSKRPTFTDIMQRLSLPDTKLLKWSEEDRGTDPEAATLGAELDAGLSLYKDIQETYLVKEDTRENISSDENHKVVAPSYEDPTLVTLVEETDGALSSFGLNLCKDIENQFPPLLAKESNNKLITNDVVVDLPAHSYEDPLLLSALAEKGVISNV